jgi:plastocyanin
MLKIYRPVITSLLVGAVLLVSACGGNKTMASTPAASTPATSAATTGASSQVTIQDESFNPASMTVSIGTTVTWTNKDSLTHNVTGSGWQSGNLLFGTSFSYTFSQSGTFDYHCSIHPFMTGKIIVQ